MDELDILRALDSRIVDAAKDIKVLTAVAWPEHLQVEFLESFRRGSPALPKVVYRSPDTTERASELQRLADEAESLSHPLGAYLRDTARSYAQLSTMLAHLGTAEMSKYSIDIYGHPKSTISGARGKTSLEAAGNLLGLAKDFRRSHGLPEEAYCVTARAVQSTIEAGLSEVFPAGVVRVTIDQALPSMAAAGATRIRLRDATCFSPYSAGQLLQHEAFVHSLTALNGRHQKNLKTLSLGAPRTTAAQEGLATFSELVTGTIDIARLARIAQRVVAIDAALSGADFIEVFHLLLESGQTEVESFNSAMRVFRGAPLTGGSAFTKDAVYLRGLLEVHTFFRWAMRHNRFDLCELAFSGRMSLADLPLLEPHFANGTLERPRYLPPWVTRTDGLGGYLAFSLFADDIFLEDLSMEHDFPV